MEIIAQRPKALTKLGFTYCPGCLHGVAHRLIAEAVDEMELNNCMAGVSHPVVFRFLPINSLILIWLKLPIGRAPAVATGMKRARRK